MDSKCHKALPFKLLFLVILCRIELIYCCSGSGDEEHNDMTMTTHGTMTTQYGMTCEPGELGGGMIDGKFLVS